jgi:hypothetical protein
LATRTVPGLRARDWRAGMWMAFAPGLLGLAVTPAAAQQNMANLLPAESSASVSSEHLERIQTPNTELGFITYIFQDRLSDQFEKRSLQFHVMNGLLHNRDLEQTRESFGNTARRKLERSITRTAARYLESTQIGMTLKDEPWKERLFNIAKDAVTEETQTLDSQLGEDDPHIDYDFESAVVRKPAWKEKVNFFLRPFSMHPNAGIGLKLRDGVRAQVKVYHDDVKFSALVPISHNWHFYSSARLDKFSTDRASLNFGFQHSLEFPGQAHGVVQYGFSLRNHEFLDEGRSAREYRPHAFFAFALDF